MLLLLGYRHDSLVPLLAVLGEQVFWDPVHSSRALKAMIQRAIWAAPDPAPVLLSQVDDQSNPRLNQGPAYRGSLTLCYHFG